MFPPFLVFGVRSLYSIVIKSDCKIAAVGLLLGIFNLTCFERTGMVPTSVRANFGNRRYQLSSTILACDHWTGMVPRKENGVERLVSTSSLPRQSFGFGPLCHLEGTSTLWRNRSCPVRLTACGEVLSASSLPETACDFAPMPFRQDGDCDLRSGLSVC